jgi:hypothetical protein
MDVTDAARRTRPATATMSWVNYRMRSDTSQLEFEIKNGHNTIDIILN